ncbi:hypothetical protein [Allomuricauda sp. NBRC 101325]|uniref:hypothetical protein n=1 Tax=Allomuricauda sp. NBRC 101325 TaxID=1113758 RepID=UPI0025524655|nr:hypothetical protein [Muricauda sp. NBRC 101325]
MNEPELSEIQEFVLSFNSNHKQNDSIYYKGEKYSVKNFELFELMYQSAFDGVTLFRVYGDGGKYQMTKKVLSEPIYSEEDVFFENGIQKLDSSYYIISKSNVEKYKVELKELKFWRIICQISNEPLCLDGKTIKISGLNGGGHPYFNSLTEIISTGCMNPLELVSKLEDLFMEAFVEF